MALDKDIETLLEVVQYDMQDIATNLKRGTWNSLGALDALQTVLSNHLAYAQRMLSESEPF